MIYALENQNVYVGSHLPTDFSSAISLKGRCGCFLFPGFLDVHVHFREPGFSYKETILTGSMAAARGGYTDVCTMPNLNPVPDSLETLKIQEDIIDRDAVIGVHPFASITKNEKGEQLSDMEELKDRVVGFSDDGVGVQSEEMMFKAMQKAASLKKIISSHCEVNELLRGGYIHDGKYAREHGHRGICSESEWGEIERDLFLAKKSGCAYHVCHISTKESVDLIRKAKKDGVDVTCETAPHYLLLDENDMQEDGRFKMNPPLRSARDHSALIEGVLDGTIDMVATDHAPHSAEEKSAGLEKSKMGIVGIETAFPLLYTYFVKEEKLMDLENLLKLITDKPRARFRLPESGYTLWNLEDSYEIDAKDFLSKGKSTPFLGRTVYGRCLETVWKGKTAWKLN